MSYRLSITIPHSRLSSTLAALPRGMKFEVERVGDDDAEVDASNGDTIISIGAKEPRAGSIADKLVTLLMELEGKHGPHRVTRSQLNAAMRKAKMTDSQLSSGVANAISSGFLKRSSGK